MTKETSTSRLTRRSLLAALTGAVLVLSQAVAEAAAKFSKMFAKYQNHPFEGHMCANCVHFRPPHRCALVEGYIFPHGACRFFKAKRGMMGGSPGKMRHMKSGGKMEGSSSGGY